MKKDKDLPLVWQLAWKMAVVCAVVLALGLIFSEEKLAWGLGVALGAGFNVVRLILMQRSVKLALEMDADKAESYTRFQYFLRYVLAGGVLIVAALVPWIDPISTFIAIVSLQLAVWVQRALDQKYYPDKLDECVPLPEEEEEEEDHFERFVAGAAGKTARSRYDKIARIYPEEEKKENALESTADDASES